MRVLRDSTIRVRVQYRSLCTATSRCDPAWYGPSRIFEAGLRLRRQQLERRVEEDRIEDRNDRALMGWGRRKPGESDDEQQDNIDRAAEQAGRDRKARGQTRRRTEREDQAANTDQPDDRPE